MKRARAALAALACLLALAGCAGAPKKTGPDASGAPAVGAPGSKVAKRSPYPPAQEDPRKRGDYTAGGLYAPHIADSAPAEDIDVSLIPEPQVVAEPPSRYGNRPTYSVLGKSYKVLDRAEGYVEQGLASYYGKKFHGRRTSNMEVYDMYAFTAAHKTLPLPSFARVTNLENGRSVVVRVNDRGPFHKGRIIDLSYAAAVKLGITRAGTGRVEVEALVPGEEATMLAAGPEPSPASPPSAPVVIAPAPAAASTLDRFVESLPAEAGAEIPAGNSADRPVAVTPVPTTVVPGTGSVVLQVASFAARANADRALAMLRNAGIDGATLHDGGTDGRPLWRLRVGPVDEAVIPLFTSRIAGLGFGTPQPVRD